MTQNHYKDSWELYKAQSESFTDDYEYYNNFCQGHKTLEIFAGYGRLTNFLISKGINIESVELESNFSNLINLPNEKKHTCDILNFNSPHKFERIIAGYNSFCLFTDDLSMKNFFGKINNLLEIGGRASLSYYPINAWKKTKSQEVTLKNYVLKYTSTYDFSNLDKNIAIWIDEYTDGLDSYRFEYPVRVFHTHDELIRFTNNTSLKLIDIIEDYNLNLTDSGWKEFIFTKTDA